MVNIYGLFDGKEHLITEQRGIFSVVEHQRDLTVSPMTAQTEYFMGKMGVRKKQLLATMDGSVGVTIQAGAMQWMAGNIESKTNIKGVGDFLGKAIKGSVTSESTVKPKYHGTGILALEPTYNYLLLEDVSKWNGNMVLEDGLFLACEASLNTNVVMRTNVSSAVLGGEGLFNLKLSGNGIAVLESPVPREELIEIELQNDQIKIDGNMAIAWSDTLNFTVEKSTRSLVGSAVAGEGFVNVFRGTGNILMAPVMPEGSNNILRYNSKR